MRQATAVAFTVVALTAGPASAQDDDWDVTRDSSKGLVSAHIEFSGGLVLAARCMAGQFDAMIGGLPSAPGTEATRTLRLAVRDKDAYDSTWNVTTNRTVAVADYPAAVARSWREGGRFQVSIPGGGPDGQTLRHDVVLPASSAAIGETLTACGKPLEDPRDVLLPDVPASGLSAPAVWLRPPRPQYPGAFKYAGGYAVVSCVNQPNGMLNDCVVESEHPQDGGFGRAALRAALRSQVSVPGETRGRYTPRRIGFRSVFRGLM